APRERSLADGHGWRARTGVAGDSRCRGLPACAERAAASVPGPHQQLHLHPPRPRRAPGRGRAPRSRGGDLDLGARHRAVPRGPAPRRLRLRRRRDRADLGPARRGLHPDRARSGLRGARRDPDVLVRADHPRHPPDRRRGALHRHQSRSDRARSRRAAAGDRLGRGAHQPRDRGGSLLRRQAESADDALRPQRAGRPFGDDGDDRRPDGHRHRRRSRSRARDHPRADRRHLLRRDRALPVPAVTDRRLDRRPHRRDL
ncbi:MAG: Hypothetical NagD-like phosphatase, Actinobacterial subfamily, partial [uncultured Solirubrobacteraceae bacterium]